MEPKVFKRLKYLVVVLLTIGMTCMLCGAGQDTSRELNVGRMGQDLLKDLRDLGLGDQTTASAPQLAEKSSIKTTDAQLDLPDDTYERTTSGALNLSNMDKETQLVIYIQSLTMDQILSLDETDIKEEEYAKLYSLLTSEQLEALRIEEVTDAGPLMKAVTFQKAKRARRARAAQTNTTPDPVTPPDGLKLSKTAQMKADGTATITLEAWTTGTVKNVSETIPTDIVLVLDESGSMSENMSRNDQTRKLAALKNAAYDFIDAVYDSNSNVKDDVGHRIAIVGFDSDNISDANTDFVEVNSDSNVRELKSKVDALSAEGATRTDLGLDSAISYYENDKNLTGQRNRVVIVFTDGSPTASNGFEYKVASSAIEKANKLKASTQSGGYGATVYAIGIMAGANPSKDPISKTEHQIDAANNFMHAISSNYNNVTLSWHEEVVLIFRRIVGTWENIDDRNTGDYYLATDNASGLNSIFQSISSKIEQATVTLGKSAIVKDVISPYFKVPEVTGDVTVETCNFTGGTIEKPQWGEKQTAEGCKVSVNSSDQSIEVGGFDFDSHFISTDDGYQGQKLVITIKNVKPIDGFIGGNGVLTNSYAGLYSDASSDKPIGSFNEPTVNVPVSYQFTTYDQCVYITNPADFGKTIDNEYTTPSRVPAGAQAGTYTLGQEIAGSAKGNDFVDVIYTIKDKDGKVVGTYIVKAGESTGTWKLETGQPERLYEDTQYKVNCQINQKDTDTSLKDLEAQAANVKVFKPVIFFKDKEIYLGDKADTEGCINVEPEWKHDQETEKPADFEGQKKPDLSYMINDVTNGIKNVEQTTSSYDWYLDKDTDYKVDVMAKSSNASNSIDITNHVISPFDRNHDFTISVKTCSLTITKKGAASGNENFIFNVKRNKNDDEPNKFQKYGTSSVVIKGNGTVKMTGLPIGTYTIQEDNKWAWRYEALGESQVTLSSDKSDADQSITITNTRKDNKWLTDEVIQSNIFKAKEASEAQ